MTAPLGLWAALAEVFPATREQRVPKTANILDGLPKRLYKTATAAMHEISEAETAPLTLGDYPIRIGWASMIIAGLATIRRPLGAPRAA